MLPYPPAGSGKPSGENHPERQCEADLEPETRTVNQDAQMIENTVKQEATLKELTRGNINGAIWSSRTPEQCAIYVRNLLPKGHGWPFYIPGPNKRLPMVYRKEGMRIGDVGIINMRGSFEFLFNICHPADHPINDQGVPKNFKHLRIRPQTDIQEHSEFNGESYISSSSITNSSGLKFESSASEGAILAMPVGAISEDVRNEATFRKYVSTHSEDWYRYINNIRGYDAKNGDLRLVTGYHKTSRWCIATFADSTANREKPFHLEFNHITETNTGKMYEWKHSGTAEVRTGPGAQEIEEFRKGDPGQEGRNHQNQSLFGRTITATLKEDIWNKLAVESEEVEVDDEDDSIDDIPPESSNQGSTGSTRTNSSTTPSSTSTSANVPGPHTAKFAMINNLNTSMDLGVQIRLVSDESHQEPALPYHPSNAINKMLLKLNPNARMAITGDNDWISLLQKDDFIFPSIEQLYARIEASLVIRWDNNVVFLEKRESESISQAKRAGSVAYSDELNSKDTDMEPSSSDQKDRTIRSKLPQTCARCEAFKVKCERKTETHPCKRCFNGGHKCITVPGGNTSPCFDSENTTEEGSLTLEPSTSRVGTSMYSVDRDLIYSRIRESSRKHRAKRFAQSLELKELKEQTLPKIHTAIQSTISELDTGGLGGDIPKALQTLQQALGLLAPHCESTPKEMVLLKQLPHQHPSPAESMQPNIHAWESFDDDLGIE